jgi:asparagine synthase (glutamine-hydrolysing)
LSRNGNLQDEILRINENETTTVKRSISYKTYNDGKNVLRKAMNHLIPQSIVDRKKQGFSAPDESWYRGENAQYIRELLLDKETASADYINQDYIKKIVHEHTNEHVNHRLLIWSFMNFEWWCRIFLNGGYQS